MVSNKFDIESLFILEPAKLFVLHLCVVECAPGNIECPGIPGHCVYEGWLCDGDDDCGNGSDENPAFCAANGQPLTT